MYEDIKLMSALTPNFVVFRLCGHWFLVKGSKIKKFAYKLYSVCFIGFWFITSLISELAQIIASFGNLEKMTEASFLFLTHMAQFIKMVYFFRNDRRIQMLSDDLSENIFKPKNVTQYKVIKKCIKEAQVLFYIFLVMSLGTVLLWAIFPQIDRSEDFKLPISAYYPFATDYSPIFEIVYIYQILAVGLNAASNVSFDITASGFMVLVCAQLDLLNDTLENINEFTKIGKLKIKGDDLFDCGMQLEMNRLLGDWVNHHKQVIRVANEIGDIFNVSVLSQFAAGCIIVCLTMFELTLVPIFSVKFASMMLYQSCMLTEIFLYCWYGNEIILKSSKLSSSAFNSDWIKCSVPYKRSLLVVMARTQVPIKLYAGNLFALSLETFAAILRSSWSYFAVLNTVHED